MRLYDHSYTTIYDNDQVEIITDNESLNGTAFYENEKLVIRDKNLEEIYSHDTFTADSLDHVHVVFSLHDDTESMF